MSTLKALLGLSFTVFVFLFSCKNNSTGSEAVEENNVQKVIFNGRALPRNMEINAEIKDSVNVWKEFSDLNSSYLSIYNLKTKEDIIVFIEDMKNKERALDSLKYPESFALPQIRSRFKVLKTFLDKTDSQMKEHQIDSLELHKNMEEIVLVFNAIKNQFEDVLLNKIDDNLLLEESLLDSLKGLDSELEELMIEEN